MGGGSAGVCCGRTSSSVGRSCVLPNAPPVKELAGFWCCFFSLWCFFLVEFVVVVLVVFVGGGVGLVRLKGC